MRRYRPSSSGERFGRATCLEGVEAMVERGSRDFEDFYQAERATLLRAVAFALGDVDLGAEATDEAMARAYERWGDVGEMANPSGWVYRVAVNLGYNRTRRRALETAATAARPTATTPTSRASPTRRSPGRWPPCRSSNGRSSSCASTSTGHSTRSPRRSGARTAP